MSRRDAVAAAAFVRQVPDTDEAAWPLKLVMAMLHRTLGVERPTSDEAEVISELLASVEMRGGLTTRDQNKLRRELLEYVPRVHSDVGGGVDTSVLNQKDLWSQLVVGDLSLCESGSAAVSSLLSHLAAATGSKPSATWLAAADMLLASSEAVAALRMLLQSVLDADIVYSKRPFDAQTPILDEGNVDVVRAAAWATIHLPDSWVVPLLRDVAIRTIYMNFGIGWFSWEKTPNACLLALGRRGTGEAVVALQQIAATTKHIGISKRIAQALEVAGSASALTASQVVERAVPTGGLGPSGTVTFSVGEFGARATIDDESRLRVEWKAGAEWRAKPPENMPSPETTAIKRAITELRSAITGERRRVEGLFAVDRTWENDEWSRYYRSHPITGRLTRRLIWTFDHDGTVATGVPDGSVLQTQDGDIALPTTGSVKLWHPATVPTDAVEAWRAWMFERGRQQPFKQAYREVYLLTAAERETETYSNRFAAHIVRYQQLFALCKERGWATNYLGMHEGGYEGCARREFRDSGITAAFDHGLVEPPDRGARVYLSETGRVCFYRTTDRGRSPIPITDVPPLVLSEAFRDLDLFISATTIAIDPEWADHHDDVGGAYWLRMSVGELGAFAEVRRDALARILPTLRIADRLELDDRFVRVRGQIGSYKVHIGSAAVFAQPDDRFVCIVARKLRSAPMLPFEGDEILAVIISKLLLLAADDKIVDPTIVAQLRRRA